MKPLRSALLFVFCVAQMQARDLYLIDGRIFKEVWPADQTEVGKFHFRHQAGSVSVPVALLSRADYFENRLHLTVPVVSPESDEIVSSSYANRNYGARNLGARSYAPVNTVEESQTPEPPELRYERSNRPKTQHVNGYYRKDGTYVQPYRRSR